MHKKATDTYWPNNTAINDENISEILGMLNSNRKEKSQQFQVLKWSIFTVQDESIKYLAFSHTSVPILWGKEHKKHYTAKS